MNQFTFKDIGFFAVLRRIKSGNFLCFADTQADKQINEFYFNYKGQNISTKVGWSLMNWSSSDKKLIERTNFTYDKNGLLLKADYFNEKQVTTKHKYTGLRYTFHEGRKVFKGSSDLFTMLWFTDIFAENLIHP